MTSCVIWTAFWTICSPYFLKPKWIYESANLTAMCGSNVTNLRTRLKKKQKQQFILG